MVIYRTIIFVVISKECAAKVFLIRAYEPDHNSNTSIRFDVYLIVKYNIAHFVNYILLREFIGRLRIVLTSNLKSIDAFKVIKLRFNYLVDTKTCKFYAVFWYEGDRINSLIISNIR